MVFEDELPPLPRSRFSIWFWRLFKIAFFLGLFFIMSVSILTRIGGNDDNLRMGLEQLLGRLAGNYPARVGVLHGVAFFPYVRVHAENITIMPLPLPAEPAAGEGKPAEPVIDTRPPLMTVDNLMFSRGFWDAFLWRSRIEGVRLEGVNTAAGYILPRAITNGALIVGKDINDGKPAAEITGKYGTHPFKLVMALDYNTINLRPSFSFPKEAAFTLSLGPVRAHGRVIRGDHQGRALAFDSLTLEREGAASRILPLRGVIEVSNGISTKNVYLTLRNDGNDISASYRADEEGALFTVDAERLMLADIGALLSFGSQIMDIYQDDAPGIALHGPADLDVTIRALQNGAVTLGDVQWQGAVDDKNIFKTGKLTGKIAGGMLSGTADLSAQEETAVLALNLKIDDFDYDGFGVANTPVKGNADAHVKLGAQGRSVDGLVRALSGEIAVLGAGGEMAGGTINLWGDGLLNAMLPDVAAGDPLAVNCLMMRFAVEKSVGTANPFLLDTTNVSVTGKGTIDLYRQTIDMTFNPDAKGVAIGTIGTAVNVEGPWAKPDVAPDALSVGKKLGGLLLGTINPLAWAWSLTDIGVGDSHPCRPYLEGGKTP